MEIAREKKKGVEKKGKAYLKKGIEKKAEKS